MRRSKMPRWLAMALFVVLVVGVFILAAGATAGDSQPISGVLAGGSYVLTASQGCSAAAPPAVLASGGNYRLSKANQPAAVGSGCCCRSYLPLIIKRR